MSGWDAIGLAGAAIMLVAYALTVSGWIDAKAGPALAANLAGSVMVLVSLSHDFNLSATIIEGAWAAIALGGLIKRAVARS